MPERSSLDREPSAAPPPPLEPIAIVGMACRFPGADDPDGFWNLLRQGVDAITEVPPDRWDLDELYDPTPGARGKMITRWGGFLKDIDQFDAGFFGISPREAVRMDPQQRLLLEAAWEALEDAGEVPQTLRGTATGVFIGISSNDYGRAQMFPALSDAYMPTGNASSIAANRISYFFDLQGPSLIVDTACSSALVAVHLACCSLWNGESRRVLAGGVNAILTPANTINFSQAGMMSPDGRCKSFDAGANGYVRGEGVGLVVLKPLSRAEADGDRIYALIRGSAVNQDGHSPGLTVPSQSAQEAVTLEACRRAGLLPGQLDYVEAHGTGTPVGDPIEGKALGRVLAIGRAPGSVCGLGSCKTNIGHLESAAGIAGLIKVALSLQRREIPPSLHFREPNPEIPFAELPVAVRTELGPWPDTGRPSLAGVNSFGFGGTNAHVVLEQYTGGSPAARQTTPALTRATEVFALSAPSPEALGARARSCAESLSSERGAADALHDVCFTASVRRTHHAHRLAAVVRSREELAESLAAFGRGEARAGLRSGHCDPTRPVKLVYVFPGQGPQWWAMARQLLEREPVFRNVVEQCDELFRRHANWSLLDELEADEPRSRLRETSVAQPALFSLQVGLAALWRSRGVVPDAVVGHSMGEAAAAQVAGILSLADAARVIYHRARLMQQATGKGKMAAIELSWDQAELALSGYEDRLSIAANNSPGSVVVSGESEPLEEVLQALQARNVFYRYLPVDYAFHSHQMEPYMEELAAALRGLERHPGSVPVFSTVSGGPAAAEDFGADYWMKNLRRPVRFAAAVAALIEHGHLAFLELSPHPTLSGAISECLRHTGTQGTVVASLRRGEEDQAALLEGLAALYVSGYAIDWRRLHPEGGRCVSLPPYAWQREHHWLDLEGEDMALRTWTAGGRHSHPLLGAASESAHPSWRTELKGGRLDYLKDHRAQGAALFPGAAYVELALAAAREALGPSARALADIEFRKPLFLPDDAEAHHPLIEVVVSREPGGSASFQVFSKAGAAGEQDGSSWTLHAEGRVATVGESEDGALPDPARLEAIRQRCPDEVPVEAFYQKLAEAGLQYGPCFRGIEGLWRGDGEALARLAVPEALEAQLTSYYIHPAVLDAAFQALAAASGSEPSGLYLPTGIARVRVHGRPGRQAWSHVRIVPRPHRAGDGDLEGEVRMLDDEGRLLAHVSGLHLQQVDRQAAPREAEKRMDEWLYELAWEPKPRPGQPPQPVAPESLPSPSQMKDGLERRLARLIGGQSLDRYDFDKMERASDAYVLRAIRTLGWEPSSQHAVPHHELESRLNIAPTHRRLFRRLLSRLAEAGVLEDREGWRLRGTLEHEDPRRLIRELLAQNPGMQAELELIERCGDRLADTLQGRCDPLELIFPGGSLTTAERLYQDSPFVSVYNQLTRAVAARAAQQTPRGHVLRILEIGAGTGGTTAHVVPRLPPDRVEYVYTDVSPVFTSHGEEKFSRHPFVSYRSLDIEMDPLAQGFAPHSFDLIIGAYVLHATKDLRGALKNVRQLLADRGLLVLLEGTGPASLYDMVFATIEGWWRFEDLELRPDYPLLSQERWLDLMAELGFTEAIAVPEKPRLRSNQTMILAQGPRVGEATAHAGSAVAAPKERGSWIIFGREGELEAALTGRLQASGERCVLVTPGAGYAPLGDERYDLNPARPDDFRRVLEDALAGGRPACRGVIYLWGPEVEDLMEDGSSRSVEAAETLCCGGALHLAQALASADGTAPARLWFVTRGVAPLDDMASPGSVVQASLWGLARVLANEHPELRCTAVDLGPRFASSEARSLLDELRLDDAEREIALRGPVRYVHRVVRRAPSLRAERRVGPQEGTFSLEVTRPGILESMVLRERPSRPPGPGEVEIQVFASGLNFLDVLSAMGLRPDRPADGPLVEIGIECAGRITAVGDGAAEWRVGDEVIAVAPFSFGNRVTTAASFVARKPARLSFEEAATIPIAFLTADYALNHLGRIRPGERILIHAAAGGVGLAAVQLARAAGAGIHATAGSPTKRQYLHALGIDHVMDSRSLAFADQVMEQTQGAGVDLVLNSLAGEAIPSSLALLRANGRFLEIGKRDIYENRHLGLRGLRSNVSFHAIDLIPVFAERPDLTGRMLRDLAARFEGGELRPLPHRAFPIDEAEDAFRYMAQARHTGKVLLTVPEEQVPVARATAARFSLSPDATYLITGGLGGFGLVVAEWMVRKGARHLVLMGRSGPKSDEARQARERMKQAGARVEIARADVTVEEDVAAVFDMVQRTMPPLRGVVHAAMVLEDASILQLTLPGLLKVMAPKVVGAWNLHRATSEARLDFFVLFGSAAALVGSPGQANYVAANSALDALALYRRARGLPAMAVDWGRLGEVGYVARHEEIGQRLDGFGLTAMRPRQALDALERLIAENPAQVAVVQADWSATQRVTPIPLLAHLFPIAGGPVSPDADHSFRDTLSATEDSQRQSVLEGYVRNELARVLRLDPTRIDAGKPLTSLGLDSLMAYELKARIESDLGLKLPIVKLVQGPSIVQFAAQLLAQLQPSLASPTSAPRALAVAETVELRGDEDDEQLMTKLNRLSETQVDSMLSDLMAGDAKRPDAGRA